MFNLVLVPRAVFMRGQENWINMTEIVWPANSEMVISCLSSEREKKKSMTISSFPIPKRKRNKGRQEGMLLQSSDGADACQATANFWICLGNLRESGEGSGRFCVSVLRDRNTKATVCKDS